MGKLDKIIGQECKLYMGILFVDWKVKFVLGQNWFGLCLMFFQLGPKNDIRQNVRIVMKKANTNIEKKVKTRK